MNKILQNINVTLKIMSWIMGLLLNYYTLCKHKDLPNTGIPM